MNYQHKKTKKIIDSGAWFKLSQPERLNYNCTSESLKQDDNRNIEMYGTIPSPSLFDMPIYSVFSSSSDLSSNTDSGFSGFDGGDGGGGGATSDW